MTTNEQPKIDIFFKTLARNLLDRASRGKVAIIVNDETEGIYTTSVYKSIEDLETDKDLFTSENFKGLQDVFLGNPLEVHVYKVNATYTIQNAIDAIKTKDIDWIGTNSVTPADQTAVIDFVKAQQALRRYYKAVVFSATVPDSKQIVNLADTPVIFNDERGQKAIPFYIPTVLGVLAGLSLNRSATFFKLENLKGVQSVSDIDSEIKNGKLVIFEDEGIIRFSTAVTSLVTVDNNDTEKLEHFTKIENVELTNMIYKDIFGTFKNRFVGTGKNTVDRQYLFISAVNTYFKTLAEEELLDINYNNQSFIDVPSQRKAWREVKGEVVDSWSDELVANTPFKTNVFLSGDIKLLESTENLRFGITLF